MQLRARWKDGAFVAGWELQSQVSSLALVAFARFGSLNSALPIMLTWALLSTFVFHKARLAGRPDLLEGDGWTHPSRGRRMRLVTAALSLLKAWLAGVQAFLYSRLFGHMLRNEGGCCLRKRLTRITVLGFGLTFFGVPTAHHLLRKAGYERSTLLRLGFVGACLNVPFRVIASAFVINMTIGLLHLPLI